MVEAVRIGTVFAQDAKQYGRWRRRRSVQQGKPIGLAGQELEAMVMALRFTNPEYVVAGPR